MREEENEFGAALRCAVGQARWSRSDAAFVPRVSPLDSMRLRSLFRGWCVSRNQVSRGVVFRFVQDDIPLLGSASCRFVRLEASRVYLRGGLMANPSMQHLRPFFRLPTFLTGQDQRNIQGAASRGIPAGAPRRPVQDEALRGTHPRGEGLFFLLAVRERIGQS